MNETGQLLTWLLPACGLLVFMVIGWHCGSYDLYREVEQKLAHSEQSQANVSSSALNALSEVFERGNELFGRYITTREAFDGWEQEYAHWVTSAESTIQDQCTNTDASLFRASKRPVEYGRVFPNAMLNTCHDIRLNELEGYLGFVGRLINARYPVLHLRHSITD